MELINNIEQFMKKLDGLITINKLKNNDISIKKTKINKDILYIMNNMIYKFNIYIFYYYNIYINKQFIKILVYKDNKLIMKNENYNKTYKYILEQYERLCN